MSKPLDSYSKLLAASGIRHHLDRAEGIVRVVFVTRRYENPRGERLAIVAIEAADEGRRLRAVIRRAFSPGGDAAATCLAACRLAATTPLVGAEYDADEGEFRLVSEIPVEDGRLTRAQLASLLDALVTAADAWHETMHAAARLRSPSVRRRKAA